MRMSTALAAVLTLALAGPASAQVVTGGAGNTGVQAPAGTGGVRPGDRDLGPSPLTAGNAANPGNASVPGTTPGVNIGGTPTGGTPTGGPPGTGGSAGGPALGNR